MLSNSGATLLLTAVSIATSIAAHASPTLAETSKFIEANIQGTVRASCETVNIKGEKFDSIFDDAFEYSIPLRQIEAYENTAKLLSLKCLSGKCIIMTIKGDRGREFDTAILKPRININRVISAIEHLQNICGGRVKQIF